jgi:hypothetical protein
MATQKIGKIWLGEGDLTSGVYSEMSSGVAAPLDIDGGDGDVYVRVSGANSNVYIKRDGTWVPLFGTPINVTIPDNTTNFVVFSIPAAVARFIRIEYGVIRSAGSRSGQVANDNDLVNAIIAEYGLLNLGTDVGLTLSSQINGANVELLATTDNQGVSAAFKFFIRSWN